MTPATPFPQSDPERQGIRSRAILAFVDAAEREARELHGFVVLRRGSVVAEGYWEPYGEAHPHLLFSLSKSFTATAIGFLVAEGRLSVDDLVLDFFPDAAPAEPDPNLRAMRVRHLLTMTTGHAVDPTGVIRQAGPAWTRAFLAQPVEHEPGTHFVYNSAATYLLSAIAQRITGERLLHYLGPRLFAPLGIAHPAWETSPEGIDVGGWGLSVTTRDVARFGQLYLQKGAGFTDSPPLTVVARPLYQPTGRRSIGWNGRTVGPVEKATLLPVLATTRSRARPGRSLRESARGW